MTELVARTLQFRCAFELVADDAPATWSTAVKLVRRWIDRRSASDALHKRWFFAGGDWSPRDSGVRVRTAYFPGASQDAPDCWSVRYDHPCTQHTMRFWRTEIGLTRTARGYGVSIANSHWLAPGYIGQDPPVPGVSVPGIVRAFIGDRSWSARAGSEPLTSHPDYLEVGEGKAWQARLVDPGRTCPLVFLAPRRDAEPHALDATHLARQLTGVAVVVAADDPALDEELQHLLPKEYRCWDGAVRVYLPGVALDNAWGARHHRYFSPERIGLLGAPAVEEMIVVALGRRARPLSEAWVTSPDDVSTREREARLRALRDEHGRYDKSGEWRELLEDENDALTKKNRELSEHAQSFENERDEWELEKEELKAELEDARKRVEVLARQHSEEQRRAAAAERGLTALQELETLPETLDEVLDLAVRIFPGQLVCTERARKSAKAASINQRAQEMTKIWTLIRSMATVLHGLYFDDDAQRVGPIDQAFTEQTGYELTLSESSMTRADNQLMAKRTDVYEDRSIDISAHIKYGDNRPPRLLRVHYFADHDSKRIIIGHCGDHLETAGTRRNRR